MKLKIDKGLLPVKLHFFFFFAALGPILPQLNVFGRQLGVSAAAMGLVTAVLPLLWAVAKPAFGYIVDYFTSSRKLIFMLLIITMTGCYSALWFLPKPIDIQTHYLNNTVYLRILYRNSNDSGDLRRIYCSTIETNLSFHLYVPDNKYISTIYINNKNITCESMTMEFDNIRENETVCVPKKNSYLNCVKENNEKADVLLNNDFQNNITSQSQNDTKNRTLKDVLSNETLFYNNSKKETKTDETNEAFSKKVEIKYGKEDDDMSLYISVTFWAFVVLMCIGTVAFNVANCIGDAVCFDVLGTERSSKYGSQRVWGTVGYGSTALLGGFLIDAYSKGENYKDFTPAFIISMVATAVDLYSCRALKLPSLSAPADAGRALRDVLRLPRVLVFITFAVMAGTFDSFIIYYMFWFIEELSEKSGHQGMIKMIEGLVVAGESFVGEVLFFSLSGRIINRFGYGRTMSFSLFCYGIRLLLISFIINPWHLVFIESIMQGPTYALCYSCIVGYAARVAPDGYSATVQGIVAGMDDGLGFTLGSLLGGQLYSYAGGRTSFQIMAGLATLTAIGHVIASMWLGEEKTEPKKGIQLTPEESERMLQNGVTGNEIYKDTTVPVVDNKSSISDR